MKSRYQAHLHSQQLEELKEKSANFTRNGRIFHSLVKQQIQSISSVIFWATYSSVSGRPSSRTDVVIYITETDRLVL
jgi:hypothetical protein